MDETQVTADARTNWHQIEIAARFGWGEADIWGQWVRLVPRLRGETIRTVHRDFAVTTACTLLARCTRDGDAPIRKAVR